MIKTTCPYCGVGCGVKAAQTGVQGDEAHPANFGRLCSKGSALADTIGMEGRLLSPKVYGQSVDWETALELVASKFSKAIDTYGPDSVAFYVSGQLLTEDYYVANKLIKGYMGTANIDTNSRLCMASSVAGHKRAFGTDTVPGCYEDLELADLLVLTGSNLAWCHPILFQRIKAAKEARPEMRVVVIDPRETATCEIADLHLPLKSDGDIALFNGLLAHLDLAGAVDHDYVAQHVNGFEAALAQAQATDITQSGVSRDLLETFYTWFAQTEKTVTVYSQGVNQSASGTDKVNAILNCHLATGRIGRAGMGPFSVTGQPNAMGGREVGGLANMLACHLDIENPDHRDAVQSAWGSPVMADKPGLKAVDLFEACESGQIKALWIMSTNPAVSMPDADRVARAIENVPFTVVSDILERTDTGDLVNVLLPATGWGEKSGTVTNSERTISRQRPFLPPPGNARPDWKIICQVAQHMGYDGFDFASEADVFREYAALSELGAQFSRDFDISGLAGISDSEYIALAPTQWPVPKEGPTGGRFFADGGFFHADGKAKMLEIAAPADVARKGLTLNTGRIRDQWHTMTRTGRSQKLGVHIGEPFVEIHPDDARAAGLADADIADLQTPQGQAYTRVLISKRARASEVFVPMHWTKQTAASGMVNALVAAVTDPVSGQPASKSTQVSLTKAPMAWHGFAISTSEINLGCDYGAKACTQNGWRAEMAGLHAPADWTAFAREMLDMPDAQIVEMSDANSGTIRVAFYDGAKLIAAFFAAPQPVQVARSYVVGLLGQECAPQVVLAGRAGADQPDVGAIVCACFNVGVNTLADEIAKGAASVDALGAATCAGTNCGSCKPELAALLAQANMDIAAE